MRRTPASARRPQRSNWKWEAEAAAYRQKGECERNGHPSNVIIKPISYQHQEVKNHEKNVSSSSRGIHRSDPEHHRFRRRRSAYIQSQMEKLNGTNKEQVIEETKKEVMNMLKKTIRPEFLNRIDETIMFLPLNESEIKQIVVLQIKGVQKMLAQNGVELILTDGAIEFLTKVGYDPEFGARPVKRAIQHYLLNDLSKKLLAQEVDRSKPIIVDAGGEGLVFKN